MQPINVSDLKAFARGEFGGVEFGDVRLDRRLIMMVQQLAADPGRSIPKAMGDWGAAKAVYRFCAHEDVTRAGILNPHYHATSARIGAGGDVLIVQDTTFLNFTHHPATEGLGPIGSRAMKNKLRGVLVHSSLAVEADSHQVLGLLDQQVIVRELCQTKGVRSRKTRPRPLESAKWPIAVRSAVQRSPQANRLIFVFDREGDTFEAVEQIQDVGARFVIRGGSNDRRLETAGPERAYLLESIRKASVVSGMAVALPAGGGRRARTAEVVLRSATYGIMPPKDRQGRGTPRDVNVLWIHEENAPTGQTGLDWLLLTSEAVDTPKAAERVVRMYCGRWKIEEWHKALKTGCKIEERQLEEWDRLEVLLGIYSVIAWRLLVLRDAARAMAECPAEVLTDEDRTILHRLAPKLPKKASARDYLRTIAKLGGFLGRKGDKDPGWMTLWHGYTRLCDMRTGFRLSEGE